MAQALRLAALAVWVATCGCTNDFDELLPRGTADGSISTGDTACTPVDGGGCYSTARTCGQACTSARATCEGACSTNQCRRQCRDRDSACKATCIQACVSCTTSAGCATQQQCASEVG